MGFTLIWADQMSRDGVQEDMVERGYGSESRFSGAEPWLLVDDTTSSKKEENCLDAKSEHMWLTGIFTPVGAHQIQFSVFNVCLCDMTVLIESIVVPIFVFILYVF